MTSLRRLPPARLARIGERVRSDLARLTRALVPAPVALLELITGAWLSQAVRAAAELRLADALASGPKTARELARELELNEDALARLLRALSEHGLFVQEPAGRFRQSALSDCLREDAEGSLRAFALYVGSREHREHWSELAEAVRRGEPVVPALRGLPFFEYTRKERAFGGLFDAAMTSLSDLAQGAILEAYSFAELSTLIDVGGGRGRLLAAILARHPHLRGVLFDLPEVVAEAPKILQQHGVSDRSTVDSGSFFERVPSGGDAYLLKHILHDWDDGSARVILRNVRAVCAPGARLLLVESVLPEDATPHYAKLLDLEMLLSVGGRERTARDFTTLLETTGFRLTRIVPTAGPISVVEAYAL